MNVKVKIVLVNIAKTPFVLCIRLPIMLVILTMIWIGTVGDRLFDALHDMLPAWDLFPDTPEEERASIERYLSSTQYDGDRPLVQDKKTGEWYNPKAKWEELQQQQWFVDLLKRMKDK